jgi:hypothetical protein
VKLTRLNDRLRTPRSPLAVAAAVFLLGAAAFLARAALQVGLDAIPGPGDEADYDLLGMQIAAGHGFGFDYDAPAWRAPYERTNGGGRYDRLLARHGAAPTTYRPPLFPAAVAGLYAAFGRSFAAVRVFNCLVMAAAGTVAAWVTARRLGPLPGLLCGLLFVVVEHRARYHAGLVLTESLASLLAVLLAAGLVRLGETGRIGTAAWAGVALGLAILNRPLVALWLPVVVPLVAWIVSTRRAVTAALFTLVALAVVVPWSIRDSLLLGRFSPLGTHGGQNLAAAYSDEAVRRGGLWFNLDETGFFPPAIDDTRPGPDRELARAAKSRAAAIDWARRNPLKLPLLAALRAWQLWQPRMHWDALILGLAALGLILWPVTADRRIFASLLLANTLAVAATWCVGGRFLVPLLPVLHTAAACGLWLALLAAIDARRLIRRGLNRRA